MKDQNDKISIFEKKAGKDKFSDFSMTFARREKSAFLTKKSFFLGVKSLIPWFFPDFSGERRFPCFFSGFPRFSNAQQPCFKHMIL